MAWWITDGVLGSARPASAANSILTDITGEGNVVIPEGVTSISDLAFSCCSSLTSIHIPDSVTSIGNGAFYQCSSLTSIHIPEGVTSISDRAFFHCSSLTSIHIPDSVTSIGNYAFGNDAFPGCSSLTSIHFPEGITNTYCTEIEGCSSLRKISFTNPLNELHYRPEFSGIPSIVYPFSPHQLRVRNFPKQARRNARFKMCIGFILNQERYTKKLRRSYLSYINQHISEFYDAAINDAELLHHICRGRILDAESTKLFIDEATNRRNAEITAMLLEYRATALSAEEIAAVRDE